MTLKFPASCLILLFSAASLFAPGSTAAAPVPDIAPAINSLGLDLYREEIKSAGNSAVLLSPYSIASVLAMTYAGADGVTKAEMEKTLHLPSDQNACGAAFQSLSDQLSDVVSKSAGKVAEIRLHNGDATPIQLNVANRLFVQRGYSLRPAFIDEVHRHFDSNLAELDFKNDATHARQVVNPWVADQTKNKIRDLLPDNQPEPNTRMMLINALYLRAAWADEFESSATKPEPFHFIGNDPAPVQTMRARRKYGYAKHEGYSVVTLPYLGGQLQFVLLVPDKTDGLASLEKSLTAKVLSGCARLEQREVILHLPKFRLEPGTIALTPALQSLGLRTAFDQPTGSANFDKMAPRKPGDYLAISNVFHKTWLVLDEHGTEAAATTVVEMLTFGVMVHSKEPPPVEVRADRPFIFAIQHVPSGTCLFLGRVTDPR
ncbi:MAG TPA: serpin family protein [Lacunisphaera sp.]|jgi:serpin B